MNKAFDDAMEQWETDTPDESIRQDIVDHITQTGTIPEGANISEGQVDAVFEGFSNHIQNEILSPLGLTLDQWGEHIDPAEQGTLYGLILRGDWATLHKHAAAVKDQMRRNPEWYTADT